MGSVDAVGSCIATMCDCKTCPQALNRGKPLLLGLDLLLAGDVVKTVALEPTPSNVSALGLLVLVRTFLSWSFT